MRNLPLGSKPQFARKTWFSKASSNVASSVFGSTTVLIILIFLSDINIKHSRMMRQFLRMIRFEIASVFKDGYN